MKRIIDAAVVVLVGGVLASVLLVSGCAELGKFKETMHQAVDDAFEEKDAEDDKDVE